MSLKLKFFASLRETLGVAAEDFELPAGLATVTDLRQHLAARGGSWERLTTAENLRCAVNQDMAGGTTAIRDGDEVAFFPPVTGG